MLGMLFHPNAIIVIMQHVHKELDVKWKQKYTNNKQI